MTTQLDVIKKFMAVLDAAISACSNFSTYADFRAQLLSDCDAETFS